MQSPYPTPELGGGNLRSERFYYDGIRRLQEVVIDPVSDTEDAALAGDPGALAALAANPGLDGDATTLGSENSQAQGAGGGGPPPATGLAREYIWGPGDRGLDELLVQYDELRAPTWVLQDAGLDAIALCDLGGSGGGARVVWQGTYDAYGSVLTAETLWPHAPLHAGHKGLFFDRLDLGVVNPSTGQEQPRLSPAAKVLGYARNRSLRPEIGRWLQRDPNATGQVLLASATHGGGAPIDISTFALASLYSDGPNVYQYVQSNPLIRLDALGRWSTAWMAPLAGGIAVNMLAGALIGGALDAMNNGDFFGTGMAAGAIGGAVGGAAFGASTAGIFASLSVRLGYAGAAGGFSGGYSYTALNGGTLRESLADGFFSAMVGGVLGYGGGAVASHLGRWGTDDLVLAGAGARARGYGVDYAGVRNGYKVQNMWEKLALDEVASQGGGRQIIDNLDDPVLLAVEPGRWSKWQVIRTDPSSGSRINIHYSKHTSGLIDDVKITYRGAP